MASQNSEVVEVFRSLDGPIFVKVRLGFQEMKALCRLLGHKVPHKQSFLINDRYRRCERCGERVLTKFR
jgi:hypothetical protein